MPRFAIAPLGLTTEGSTKFKPKGWKRYLKKLQCRGCLLHYEKFSVTMKSTEEKYRDVFSGYEERILLLEKQVALKHIFTRRAAKFERTAPISPGEQSAAPRQSGVTAPIRRVVRSGRCGRWQAAVDWSAGYPPRRAAALGATAAGPPPPPPRPRRPPAHNAQLCVQISH